MDNQLQKLIELRKEEARKKDISGKACVIAEYLGSTLDSSQGRDKAITSTFRNESFVMEYRHGEVSGSDGSLPFFGVEVQYQGRLVFKEGGGTVYSFVPGEWEEKFNELYQEAFRKYQQAQRVKGEEERQRETSEEEQERLRWGL